MVLSVNEDVKDYNKMQKLDNKQLIKIIKNKDELIENLLEKINEMFGDFQKIDLSGYDEILLDKEELLFILRRDNILTDDLENEIEYFTRKHNNLEDYYNLEEINDVIEPFEEEIDNIIYENDDRIIDCLDIINNEDVSNEEITMENIDNLNEDELPF